MKVSLTTTIALAATAQAAAHLQPHNAVKRDVAGRDLAERDVWSDIVAWWEKMTGGYPAPSVPASSGASSATVSNPSLSISIPSVSVTVPGVPGSSTGGASTSKPTSSAKPSGTASATGSVGTSLKPVSCSSAGTGSAATSSKPVTNSGTGNNNVPSGSVSAPSSSKPSQSASGSAPSSSKPATSASGSVSAPSSVKPSGSSASACPKPPSKSRSGTGAVTSSKSASGTGASGTSPTKSASGSASGSGTGVKTSSRASGTGSSRVPTSSAVLSVSTSAGAPTGTGPTASAPAGTFVGAAYNGVDQFLNIPYAQPPVGDLRFRAPAPLQSSLGVYEATTPPNACPQFAQRLTGNYSAGGLQSLFDKFVYAPTTESEDCLTINIFRPNGTSTDAKLPIVYWIFGGGWQFGSTSMYNGTDTVRKSVQLGAPIMVVAVNYRLGGFGFLHGADLAAEHNTNLGLRDQWAGLQWVADNIASFGGDPSKVTLWGESAGSISSAYLLTVNGGNNTYNGKALFRGSIHNSGAFAPSDNGTAKQAQEIYDTIVDKTGCTASSASERLACLRSVDFVTLHNATTSIDGFGSYRSADLPYLPRTDDSDPFYNFAAEYAVAAGRWTKTPFIIGNQEDEGTLLAIVQNNITTNDLLIDYIATWFPNNPNAKEDVRGLAALYPDNPEGGQPDGSPYGTGSANNLYPQYKRLAAILGDIVFIITRRALLNLGTGQGVPAWSYIATYLKGLQNFGTLHGSDLAYLWDAGFAGSGPTNTIQTHYISFINYQDPNKINGTSTGPAWPAYNSSSSAPEMLYFGAGETTIGNDSFRAPVYEYLLNRVTVFRV